MIESIADSIDGLWLCTDLISLIVVNITNSCVKIKVLDEVNIDSIPPHRSNLSCANKPHSLKCNKPRTDKMRGFFVGGIYSRFSSRAKCSLTSLRISFGADRSIL